MRREDMTEWTRKGRKVRKVRVAGGQRRGKGRQADWSVVVSGQWSEVTGQLPCPGVSTGKYYS